MTAIAELSRELRKRETPTEKILWAHLRNRSLYGKKFIRQYAICVASTFGRQHYYIPDFYCHESRLVIELDGPIHLYKVEYDRNRDLALKEFGLTILRFTNDEVTDNTQQVLDKIGAFLF